MRVIVLALIAAVVASLPVPAMAADTEVDGALTGRYVLSLRADAIQVHSEVESFFAFGGSAGIHIPFGDHPLGLEVMTSIAGGSRHLLSTTDLSLRYYLPTSGRNPGNALQPYVKLGPTLSGAFWDQQATGWAVGGVVGLGLHTWLSDLLGLTFELTHRVMGGDELRQTLMLSVGIALRPG